MKVVHPSVDVDDRQLYQLANAGFFLLARPAAAGSAPATPGGHHQPGIYLDFINGLKDKGYCLSADMQSFVRQVQPVTHQIAFQDVPAKQEIVRQLNMVKLDVVEAKVLTGTDDLARAARLIEFWGCPKCSSLRPKACWRKPTGRRTMKSFPIGAWQAAPGGAIPPSRLIWLTAWIMT